MNKKELLILLLIFLGAFVVRMYKFNSPVADWHSWRQTDTSSVSRNFVLYGFDLLHPTFQDLSIGVSLLDNPKGYRFVEFPIYNVLQAGSFVLFHHFTLEQWGRLVTIVSSLISIIFLFLLVRKHVSGRAALFTSFFFAFLPYNVYYGRTILPDPLMVTAMLGGLYFFDLWTEKFGKNESQIKMWSLFVVSLLLTASALLLKPFGLFFLLPFAYLLWERNGFSALFKWQFWIFFILAVFPLLFWREWMLQYPEGIPRNDWLYNGNGIRFKGAFFWWIFAERIAHIILGYWGLPIVIIGTIIKNKANWFFHTCVIAVLAYLTVFATGNVQHDYYQILIIPTLAIFFGIGVDGLLNLPQSFFHKYVALLIIVVSIIFMEIFAWYDIRGYYNINHPEIIEAGKAVDELTPKNAKVIAVYGGDTTFLYQTKRQGWPVFERSLTLYKKAGAGYIVFANPTADELNFSNYFATVKKTNTYAIFDLTRPIKAMQ